MSIEQTDQLIRLILNSLLLAITSVIILSSLLMRHTAIANQFRATQQEYFELIEGRGGFSNERLVFLKIQLRRLRQHYSITHFSVLAAHYAVLCCMASALVMAFRTLIHSNWLINAALILFIIGVTILLTSVGITLLDFYLTHRSLKEELNWVLNLGTPEPLPAQPAPRPRRSREAARAWNKRAANL